MRLPVVAIAIAALCFVAFLITWVFAPRNDEVPAFLEFKGYYASHPYLTLPAAARGAPFDEDFTAADVQPPTDDAQLREEQAELDRRFQGLLDALGGPMRRWSLVPARGLVQPGWLTSLFLHFGWLHLLGNLLFLYLAAPLLEDAWGRVRFAIFYVAGGLVANLAQFGLDPHAQSAIAGASGAIAACMGAFTVRFATQKVRMAYFVWLLRVWAGTVNVPAWLCGAAWFALELLDLRGGGAAGVATGAHVGGFALGALFAFSLRGLGLDKALRTAEEAHLDVARETDLMQSAISQLAQGDHDGAKQSLIELLKAMPGREDAELMLAEIDLKNRAGTARFERHLRKLLARNDSAVVPVVVKLWPWVQPPALSAPFALQLVKHLTGVRDARLDETLEPLLQVAAAAGGRAATEVERLRAQLADSGRVEPPAIPAAPAAAHGAGIAPTINPVTFQSISAAGLTLLGGGETRTLPFASVLAIHAGVAPVDGRRVLHVDLIVRRAPPMALRLTSDDANVAALFPTAAPQQAWASFVAKLLATTRATPLSTGFQGFESVEALNTAWAAILGA